MMFSLLIIESFLNSSLLNVAPTAPAAQPEIKKLILDIFLIKSFMMLAISITMAGAFIGAGIAMSIPLGNFVEKTLDARGQKDSEVSSSDFLADLILGIAFAESIILLGVLVSAAITSLV